LNCTEQLPPTISRDHDTNDSQEHSVVMVTSKSALTSLRDAINLRLMVRSTGI